MYNGKILWYRFIYIIDIPDSIPNRFNIGTMSAMLKWCCTDCGWHRNEACPIWNAIWGEISSWEAHKWRHQGIYFLWNVLYFFAIDCNYRDSRDSFIASPKYDKFSFVNIQWKLIKFIQTILNYFLIQCWLNGLLQKKFHVLIINWCCHQIIQVLH